MKHDIDWTAIEQARRTLAQAPQVPDGWLTATMYAKERGITRGAASGILKRMAESGLMDRQKVGQQIAYRLNERPKRIHPA